MIATLGLLPDEQGQGGRAKLKLESGEAYHFLPNVVDAACINFAKCLQLPTSLVNKYLIMYRSPSVGIAGWSHPDLIVLDYVEIDRERRERERLREPFASWIFGPRCGEEDIAEKHNAQVAKIISALGESGAGRRAVLKAVAERQGVCEDETEKL